MSLRRVVLVALVLLSAVAVVVLAQTEADFKKMKIKDLRKWLDDRGLSCADCNEKVDLVRFCVAHASAPVRPEKIKVALPEGAFWEVWAKVAQETCEGIVAKKEADAGDLCKNIAVATDSVFMQYGKRTATKLKKKPAALLATSWGDTYQSAGRRLFSRVVSYCLKNKDACSSSSKLQTLIEATPAKIKGVDFQVYLTNVGIENTNPMYEVLKEKTANDEL